MNNSDQSHLSNEQFTVLLLGGALDSSSQRHLAHCEQCREESQKFTESVNLFSTTSLTWSERQPARSLRSAARSHARRTLYAPLLSALAVLLLILGVPAWHHIHPDASDQEMAADSAAQVAQDNDLLRSVNVALNTSEASPLPEYRLAANLRQASRTDARTR